MEELIYFDNAATTRPCESAVAEAHEALIGLWANPSSLYGAGFRAQKAFDEARHVIAGTLCAGDDEIVFTASGTESNNIAVFGLARARGAWGKKIVTTAYEHPSVQNAVAALREEGFETVEIKPENGVVDPEKILAEVDGHTALVAVMGVNNETGAVIDVAGLSRRIKRINPRTAVHVDWVQGYMKLPLDVGKTDIDTLSVSGHKIHAPKGSAALYVKKNVNMKGLIFGGLQEGRRRPGTENVAYARAFAAAAAHTVPFDPKPIKERIVRGISTLDNVIINSPPEGSDYILNFSLVGYKSETVLHFLESKNILVSSGSACSKGAKSHTLAAMGLPAAVIDSALRLSFSYENTLGQAEQFIAAIKEAREVLAHK